MCFLQFFWLFFDISKLFCRHHDSISWNFFSPMCLYTSFESLCSVNFFHLSRFRNQISPPNVFWGKFQHSFSTLKHYNLTICATKWLQILCMSSKTCLLQDCTVEICITWRNLGLYSFKSNDVFGPRISHVTLGLKWNKPKWVLLELYCYTTISTKVGTP